MVCIGVGSTLTASVALAAPAAAALTVQAAALAAEAAALAVQAADAAARVALEAVGRAGEKLAAEGEQQFDAETTSRRWHMAAAEAVGVNATIRMLAAQARRAGFVTELPRPIALDGRSLDTVTTWLVRTAPLVQRAQEEVARASMSARRERLIAQLAIAVDRSSVGDALRRYAETLVHTAGRSASAAPLDLSWVDAEVHDALAELDPDAAATDRDEVLLAASLVARQTDDADAGAFLDALTRLIRKEINPRAAAARLAARWSEGLEQQAVADAVAADPSLPAAGVVKELAELVDGSGVLTPDLRSRAQVALRWAADLTRVAYRTDLLRTLLGERGYQAEPAGAGRLRVTHDDWSGEHTATVWLDSEGGVHHQLVGAAQARGDADTDREAARHAEVGRDVADAVHDMTHDGVHGLFVHAHDVQHQHHQSGGTTAIHHRPAPRARALGHDKESPQ